MTLDARDRHAYLAGRQVATGNGATPPRRPQNQLDRNGETPIAAARQPLDEPAPAAPAGQATAPGARDVDGAHGAQVAHEPRHVAISDGDTVDVEHRLRKA